MPYPPAPDGLTVYVVGDVHGRLDLLADIHARIDADKARSRPSDPVEVYVGDYIDRGPDSSGVIQRLIERSGATRTAFLRGNHEQILLDFLAGEDCWRLWSAVGGLATLLSYGVPSDLLSRLISPDVIRRRIAESLPAGHRAFLERTGSYLAIGPYLVVHAGVRPGKALGAQSASDLLTIRREFLDHQGDFGFIVVHGHTPVLEPELRPNRINIDTGAFATNRLTCLRIDGDGPGILESDGCRLVGPS